MSADHQAGAAVWIWVLVGLVIGVVAGWWFDELVPYMLLAGLLGWFTGLSLAHLEGRDGH